MELITSKMLDVCSGIGRLMLENGACYVLGGDARRISSNMVLYVPAGVNIGDACTDLSSMFSMR